MSDLFQGIASLTKTVQQTFNSYEVRKLGDKVQGYVMNFTETEQKVREATNEDPWGPTGPEMQEIASLTFQYDQFSEVMGMLWKRMMQDNKVAWRRVYKSLILLNHLLKNGSERVISTTRDHMFELRALESYKCLDERGKDEGINVRHRAKLILELLNDEELLRTERRKAKTEGKEKYQGFSKDDMLVRGGGASSKFDSFERWNEKKESRSMDFNGKKVDSGESGGGGRREVTAFDFDESRSHANGSPELGIRERTPEPVEVNDDDDFGDFTSARATNKTPSSVAVASIQNQSAIKLQAFSPSNALKSTPNAAKAPRPPSISSIGGGDIDLLGIGDFGNNFKLPANHTPQPINSNILLDDLFSNTTSPTPVQKTNSTNAPDLFDLFSSPPQSTINTEQKRQELFNPLAGGFAQSNANGIQANSMPVASFTFDEQKPQPSKGNNAKLGSTWEDLKGKVNIDFDNLSLKNSPTKATPSLNELKNSTPKEPNLGGSLW